MSNNFFFFLSLSSNSLLCRKNSFNSKDKRHSYSLFASIEFEIQVVLVNAILPIRLLSLVFSIKWNLSDMP